MVEIPDFPPAPCPGELVEAEFRRRNALSANHPDHLNQADWNRFLAGIDNFTRNLRTVAEAHRSAGPDVYISPLWNQPLSRQFRREADRLSKIEGRPEHVLWNTWALEYKLNDG